MIDRLTHRSFFSQTLRKTLTISTLIAVGSVSIGAVAARADDAEKAFTIGYSVGLMDPFQVVQADMMTKAASLNELTALPALDGKGDAKKQDADVRSLVASGAQGLVIVPGDSKGIVPALDFAASKNIPVVAIDTGPAGSKVAMIVRSNNARMGEDACKAVGAALSGKGKVLSLMGEQATINGHDRTVAFDECMTKNFSGITVVEHPTHWDPQQANKAATEALAANADIGAVYLQSDGVMLDGVLDVMKKAGKLTKTGTPAHIFVVTIDGTPGALKAIRAGEVDVVISQPMTAYVDQGLSYLQQAVAGKSFKPGPTDHNSEIVTFEGNLMDLLPAPIVTAANVDSPNLWGNRVK